jgi:hypothetical protein
MILITSNSTITVSRKIRITQIPLDEDYDEDQLWQLPGLEWDIKDGPLEIEPYWDVNVAAIEIGTDNLFSILPRFKITNIATTASEASSIGNVTYNVFIKFRENSFSCIRSVEQAIYSPVFEEQMNTVESNGGTQFQGDISKANGDVGKEVLNSEWAFVDSFVLEKIEGNESNQFLLDLDFRTFGPYMIEEARRYQYWRGPLRFKFLIPRGINNQTLTVAHTDWVGIDRPGYKPEIELRSYPHIVIKEGGEGVIDVGWRAVLPYLGITQKPTKITTNGFLQMSLSGTNSPQSECKMEVTVYVDASQLEFVIPAIYYASLTPGAALRALRTPKSSINKILPSAEDIIDSYDLAPESIISNRQRYIKEGKIFDGNNLKCIRCNMIFYEQRSEREERIEHSKRRCPLFRN